MSAGLCLRLVAIGRQGLFKDEIFSASYTGLSWFETIVACLRYDVHSPTYYLQLNLYRTSTRIPGGAAEMVRSCSAGERFLAAMDNQCEHATRIASYSFCGYLSWPAVRSSKNTSSRLYDLRGCGITRNWVDGLFTGYCAVKDSVSRSRDLP